MKVLRKRPLGTWLHEFCEQHDMTLCIERNQIESSRRVFYTAYLVMTGYPDRIYPDGAPSEASGETEIDAVWSLVYALRDKWVDARTVGSRERLKIHVPADIYLDESSLHD